MDDFEFGKPILSFMTVGVLRELLKDYSDNTPIYVCGAPGVFFKIMNNSSFSWIQWIAVDMKR